MFTKLNNKLKRIFGELIDTDHIITPFAVEHLHRGAANKTFTYKVYYVFGIRVAYYNTVAK